MLNMSERDIIFDSQSAWDMMVELAAEDTSYTVSTCSSDFDKLIGGGIHMGYINEIIGEAGSGKSQLW